MYLRNQITSATLYEGYGKGSKLNVLKKKYGSWSQKTRCYDTTSTKRKRKRHQEGEDYDNMVIQTQKTSKYNAKQAQSKVVLLWWTATINE